MLWIRRKHKERSSEIKEKLGVMSTKEIVWNKELNGLGHLVRMTSKKSLGSKEDINLRQAY